MSCVFLLPPPGSLRRYAPHDGLVGGDCCVVFQVESYWLRVPRPPDHYVATLLMMDGWAWIVGAYFEEYLFIQGNNRNHSEEYR